MNETPTIRRLALAWLVVLLPSSALAGGGWRPMRALVAGDELFLAAPEGDFRQELEALAESFPLPVRVASSPRREEADLREALQRGGTGIAPSDSMEIVERYMTLRESQRAAWSSLVHWMFGEFVRGTAHLESRPMLAPPADLEKRIAGTPEEFQHFARGAAYFLASEDERARESWRTLLRLPEDQRRYRSVRAAYMLGKSWSLSDSPRAIHWFTRTRALAEEGFEDPDSLALESYDWLAHHALANENLADAMEFFFIRLAGGTHGRRRAYAALRIRRIAGMALEASPEDLAQLARKPLARRIVTAYLVSMPLHDHPCAPDAPCPTSIWLQALEHADVENVEESDRLAWAAYQSGEVDIARRWITRAPEDRPIARWIEAKILAYDGKLEESAAVLRKLSTTFPELDGYTMAPHQHYPYERGQGLAPHRQVALDEGGVEFARGQYVAALDAFLRSGFWLDAAYIAERLLSTDELRSYVDERWPLSGTPPIHVKHSPTRTLGDPGIDVRYVLARRLARDDQFASAQQYLPTVALIERLTLFVENLEVGRDVAQPSAARARALWEAASITRRYGMALFGTELFPDWSVFDGRYRRCSTLILRNDSSSAPGDRCQQGRGTPLERWAVTEDERDRTQRHLPSPPLRFHYRYRALALAEEATALLPDGSEDRARILSWMGCWMTGDPERARSHYREMTRCCGDTATGHSARRRHWFQCPSPEPWT